MKVSDFDFHLPEELIAQSPLKERVASRLLVLDQQIKRIEHKHFYDIKKYLKPGDCLVLNDTQVIPARLFGVKKDTAGKVELLLLHEQEENIWEALVKPAKRVKVGTTVVFGNGQLQAVCTEIKDGGIRLFKLSYDGILLEILNELGEMPLPPYIKQTLTDQDRYQTVYAKEAGSAAAPTAGLHFNEQLLTEIKQQGVEVANVTLHVGLGTFRPMTVEHVTDHEMHAEYYRLTEENADKLNKTKERQGKVIAVGTTATRVLETVAHRYQGNFVASSGWTNIFIYPPYQFQAIDGLITNFHLPKSTLLMLVSAMVDRETILDVYQEAVDKKYRFFSFGDAMFILPKRDEMNASYL